MRAWSVIDKYIDSTDTVTTNHWCRVIFGKMCTTMHEKVAAWKFFLHKLLEKRYITESVYAKALEQGEWEKWTPEF
jgi:nicotinamide riboside kinase